MRKSWVLKVSKKEKNEVINGFVMMNCSSSVLNFLERIQLVCLGQGLGLGNLGSLEAQLVDNGGGDSSKDRSQKVDPQVGVTPKDNVGSKGPGRVHAGAGQGDGEQVASGDGQTNGQGCRSFDTGGVVIIGSGSKDNQHQDEGDEEFDAKSLSYADGHLSNNVIDSDFMSTECSHSNSTCSQLTQKGLKL